MLGHRDRAGADAPSEAWAKDAVKDFGRQVRFGSGGSPRPKTHCPNCNEPLGNELEIAAFEVLERAGRRFGEDIKHSRQVAFDNLTRDIAENMAVLVAGRLASLDGISKILLSTHTMLGAPKIETESGDNPMELIEAFLSGEPLTNGASGADLLGGTEDADAEADEEE